MLKLSTKTCFKHFKVSYCLPRRFFRYILKYSLGQQLEPDRGHRIGGRNIDDREKFFKNKIREYKTF